MNRKISFYSLLFLWFIIDLIQLSFTGVLNDEAYYYSWGQHLDWGYFDHPPLVAVLTYLGDLIFNGRWSVRFFTALIHVFTVLFIWKTIDDKHKQNQFSALYFLGIAFSMPMFSAYGFITTPDSVLLFFFALSAWALKQFMSRQENLDILWLSIGIAGMILSKYHAFLVIIIALMSYLKILKEKRFWLVIFLIGLIIIPHFLWLNEHDFITFKYHLIERSKGFKIDYLLEYIPSQFAVLNPYYLFLFLLIIFKKIELDSYAKVMKNIAIGVLLFFAVMTLRGRVEAHWTTIASIPILYLVFSYLMDSTSKKTYLKYIIVSFVIIIISARILIMLNKIPGIDFGETRVEYYQKMNAFVKQKPVVFIGSFQEPASYYYANKSDKLTNKAFYKKRETQFELWGWQEQFLGKEVFIAPRTYYYAPEHQFQGETFRGWFVDHFQDSRYIEIEYDLAPSQLKKGKSYSMNLTIKNTSPMDYDFNSKDMRLQVKANFVGDDPTKLISARLELNDLNVLKSLESQTFSTTFKVPEKLNLQPYNLNISIFSKLGYTSNSEDTLVEITK